MKLVLLVHLKMPELKMKKRVDERERQSPSEPQFGSMDGNIEERSFRNIIKPLNSVWLTKTKWAVLISTPVHLQKGLLLCLD